MKWLPSLDQYDDLANLQAILPAVPALRFRDNARGVVFGDGHPECQVDVCRRGPGSRRGPPGKTLCRRCGSTVGKDHGVGGAAAQRGFYYQHCKCRPPGNRLPKREEAETCFSYLVRQIELIQPRLIVCLGGLSTQYLVHKDARVTVVRGLSMKRAASRSSRPFILQPF